MLDVTIMKVVEEIEMYHRSSSLVVTGCLGVILEIDHSASSIAVR